MTAAPAPDETIVTVTGGSGYVGSWTIVALLRAGYRVRTTIRSLAREAEVRAGIAREVDPGDLLSFVAADLLADAGWDEAVTGSDTVIHVASPMPIGEYRGQDAVRPAREGTARVLQAAARANVRRVVMTSSVEAARPDVPTAEPIDEQSWTDLPDAPIHNYPRSKTLAEQDAWAFARAPGQRVELSTVLPGMVLGPLLGRDYSASIDVIRLMLRGKMPLIPALGFNIVDVRDLAEINIMAMTQPAAAGERFIAAGEFFWLTDIARTLRAGLGERGAKVPRRRAPDWLIRVGARFNAEMAQLAPNLGVRRDFSSAKAGRLLGWCPRPAALSIVDTAQSLIEHGLA